MEGEDLKFNIVLPTTKLPPALAHIKSQPNPQFIVGYRNLLNKTSEGVNWCLIKDSKCCGRAFVFEISQQDTHTIQQIKSQGELIQTAGQNYILLHNESQIKSIQEPLTVGELRSLLDVIGGVSKINLNLVKNAFYSRESYISKVGKAVNELGFEEKTVQLSAADQVKLSFNYKHLSGKQLLRVPLVSKETDNVVEGKFLELKLSSV